MTLFSFPTFSNASIAFGATALAFLAIAAAEKPSAPVMDDESDPHRVATNFALGVINALLAVALPLSTIAAAMIATRHQWGLFPLLALPWAAGLVSLLLLRSLAAYGLHRASHALPLLWRIHRVHHSDGAFDLSTAFRSHPVEVLLVSPIAAGIILATGASVGMVFAVDTILLLVAMWEHGDLCVPTWAERTLGLVIATPAQHRVHHAPERARHDRNFGDTLILWDRLFGTYVEPNGERKVGLVVSGTSDGLLGQLKAPFARG